MDERDRPTGPRGLDRDYLQAEVMALRRGGLVDEGARIDIERRLTELETNQAWQQRTQEQEFKKRVTLEAFNPVRRLVYGSVGVLFTTGVGLLLLEWMKRAP